MRLNYRPVILLIVIILALAGPLAAVTMANEPTAPDNAVTVYLFTRVNGEYTDDVLITCNLSGQELSATSQAMSIYNDTQGIDYDGPGVCMFKFNNTTGYLNVSAGYFGLSGSLGPVEINSSYANLTIDLNGNMSNDTATYYVFTMAGGVMSNGITVRCDYGGETLKKVSRDMSIRDMRADIEYEGPGVCKFILPNRTGPITFRVIHGGDSYVKMVDAPAFPSTGQLTFELPYVPPPDGSVLYVFTRVNGEFMNDVKVVCEQNGVQYEDNTRDMSVLEHGEMIEHEGPGACKFILPSGSGDVKLTAYYMGVKDEGVVENPGAINSYTFFIKYIPGQPSPTPITSPMHSVSPSPARPSQTPSPKTPAIGLLAACGTFLLAGGLMTGLIKKPK